MHWGPLALRLSAVAVNLFVVAILILSLLPLATGDLQVRAPEGEQAATSFEDGVLTMSIPLEIFNGGYFDIDDVRVLIKLGQDGIVLTEAATDVMSIQAGKLNRLDPAFSFDLSKIDKEGLEAMVFERTQMEYDIGVEGSYTLGLVNADIGFQRTMEWEPLIDDLAFAASDPPYVINGTSIDILVRYSFDASSLLRDRPVGMAFTLGNDTAMIGDGHISMVLQDHNEGVARITVPQEAAASLIGPQDLTLGIDISVLGVEAHLDRDYHWEGVI